MKEEFKKRLGEIAEGKLVALMSDGVRLVGIAPEIEFEDQDEYTTLLKAGVIVVQRGAVPGKVQGVVQQVKIVSIASIDYCPGPMPRLCVSNSSVSWWYEPAMLGEYEDELVSAYIDFVEGKPSLVEHKNPNRLA